MLNSVWDDYGSNCYNYFTPDNLPCGCVATALAQLIRYHRYPDAPKPTTLECFKDSIPQRHTIQQHRYNYDLMKLVPEYDWELESYTARNFGISGYNWYDGGATEEQRKAIGTLTYDCGIAMRMNWGKFIRKVTITDEDGNEVVVDDHQSASTGAFAFEPLTNIFGYACAKAFIAFTNIYQQGNISESDLKQIILPNLDAGYPVLMGVSMATYEFGHELVVDGYGFYGGKLYLHLNMGWSGADNGWYAMPYLRTRFMEFQSRIVQHVVYNIFPRESGEILSGRVLTHNGIPVANARVEALNAAGAVVASTVSSEKGIYAFILEGGRTYRVRASTDEGSWMSDNITLGKSVNPYALNFNTGDFRYSQMKCGNSWGNDITLSNSDEWTRSFTALFDGLPVTFAHDDNEGWTVAFYDDVVLSKPIELPDNLGRVTLDMRRHVARMQGSSAVPVTLVHAEADGYPTMLRVMMSDNKSAVMVPASVQAGQSNMGSITGGNVVVEPGKTVNLKATPAKGCVFAGWYANGNPLEGTADYRNTSFAYVATDEPAVITAKFARSDEDYIQIDCTPDTYYPPGQEMNLPVKVYSLSLPTVSVTELPRGTRFDAETSAIVGTPATPGETICAQITVKNQTEKVGKTGYAIIKIGDAVSRLLPYLRQNDTYAYPVFEIGTVPDMAAVLGEETMATLAEGGWTISGLPNGMKFDSATGLFSGAPVDPDRAYLVTFKKGTEIATVTFVTGSLSLPELKLSMHVYDAAGERIPNTSLPGSFSVKGAGTYPVGADVSLSASFPSGYVFAGWYIGDEPVSNGSQDFRTASGFKFKMPMLAAGQQAVVVTAVFWPLSEDEESLKVNVENVPAAGADGSFSFDLGRCISSFTVPKVTLSGLPKGLKFDSKALIISGTATTPGIYKVKVSATNASVKKATPASSGEFTITIPNFTTEMFSRAGLDTDGKYVLTAGAAPDLSSLFSSVSRDGWKLSVSGLPSGVKYDSKKGGLTGVASKEGAYTVFFTATKGKEKQIATATFEVIFPTLTLKTAAWNRSDASGTVAGGGKYPIEKKVALKATPAKGSVFVGWYTGLVSATAGDAVDVDTAAPISKEASFAYMTTSEDVTLIAMFATEDDDKRSLIVTAEDDSTADDGTYLLDLCRCVQSLSRPKINVSGLPKGLKYDAKTLTISGKATVPGLYTVKIEAANVSVKKATPDSTGKFKLVVPNFKTDLLPYLKSEADDYGIIRCGVAFDEDLVNCNLRAGEAGWTVKVSGLPSGLKWDAQKGVITGVTAAKAGAYTVTFTASKKREPNQVATITLKVETLPDWAVGTFAGKAELSADYGGQCGIVTMTVTDKGKISGKLLESDKTWALSATSYDKVWSVATAQNECNFWAIVTGKCGKETFSREMEVKVDETGRGIVNMLAANSTNVGADGLPAQINCTAWQNLWKSKPWKTMAKPFAKAPPVDVPVASNDAGVLVAAGTISLKFAASGAVSASGKFVTGQDAKGKDVVYSSNCSAALVPDADRFSIYLYFPAKAGKFDGYAAEIHLEWNGSSFKLKE